MIDTKLLRQKILDLAIRGKLVPQDPKDEPASELLKKIKAEKEALIKAGKLKRDKHESFIFRGDDKRYYEQIDGKTIDITDEIPFDLPDSWAWCRLGILCKIKGGKRVPKGDDLLDEPTPYVYLRVTDMKAGTICDFKKKYISEETFKKIANYTISKDDVYLTIAGTIGLVGFIPEKYDGMSLTENAAKLTNISINKLFLGKILTAGYFQNIFNEKRTQVAQPKLALERVATVLFPLPPLAEQQRIVEQVETLLKYVDIIDSDAETLDKSITLAKQKILDLAIRGKLVQQDPTDEPASELLKKIKAEKDALVKAGKIKKDKHESFIFKGDDNCYHENIYGKVTDITEDIPFDLPDEWEWCRLSTISEFDLGKTLDRQKNTGNYRKYLRSVNVLWGNIDLSDVKEMRFEDTELERYSIKKGDLLICEGGDVGRCAVWDKDFVFYYQNALHRVRFYQKCISLFFQFVMMFFENTGLLKEISQGVTIKHLTKNTLNSMFFPLPPLAEQKRIVSQVEKLFTVLETMRG